MILVTGATGFVGRHVVRRLLDCSLAVRCLVRDARSTPARLLQEWGAEVAVGRVSDMRSLLRAAEGTTAVVHLVAIIRETDASFGEINYRGTVSVLDAAQRSKVHRFIHVSALGADPSSPYPYLRSKGLGEEAVRQSELDYTILRPSVVFGEGDEFINLLTCVVKALPIVPILGSGRTRLQPIWVGDVAESVRRLTTDSAGVRQTYDLGGPVQATYEQIVDLIVATLQTHRLKVHVPLQLVGPMARAMDRVLPHPPLTPGLLGLLNVDNTTRRSATSQLIEGHPRSIAGNIDYVRQITFFEAQKAIAGFGLHKQVGN